MSSSRLGKLIEANQLDNVVDLKSIVATLGIKVVLDETLLDHCYLYNDAQNITCISLKRQLPTEVKKTLLAVATAEYLLTPERVASGGIRYDVFFLKELYKQRFSYRMLLATRLVMPETIIEEILDERINPDVYAHQTGYDPQFIRSGVKHDSAYFLVTNFANASSF